MSKKTNSCSCGNGCCDSGEVKKQILIDFLYLDLSVCERCQGTGSKLYEAVDEVDRVLKAAGFEIIVNKININSKELAIKYKFVSSPTIRINGDDIEMEVKESSCKDCGDLCGDDVECRVWEYEGIEYKEPPKAMIVNAIMSYVYGGKRTTIDNQNDYVLPNNLSVFFDGLNKKKTK